MKQNESMKKMQINFAGKCSCQNTIKRHKNEELILMDNKYFSKYIVNSPMEKELLKLLYQDYKLNKRSEYISAIKLLLKI